jgi:hypothetical protein
MISIVLTPAGVLAEEDSPGYQKFSSWAHHQEIKILYNTKSQDAKFQPVDIFVKFDNICWAKDTIHHSIRVVYQNKGSFKELESQIYDLNYHSENIISSCNLVFLIPEDADGNEKYFIYYDEDEKGKVGYVDRVSIEESYYRYEPVQGLFLESWYYAVKNEEFIVYAVSQKGETLNSPISQQLLKLKSGAKTVQPDLCEQAISFDMSYWWFKDSKWNYISTSEKLVTKKIISDGNLMVKFAVISQSLDESLQSTVYYTYYYSPLEEKNIYTNVKHEVLKHPLPKGDEIDVSFAVFNSGVLKSSKIKELNFGSIPPYLHFYSKENRIIAHEVDTNPENVDWQTVISKQDDYNLGSFPWASIDYGEKGPAYGLIFDSVDVVKSGEGEPDGISIQLFQSNSIKLPGIKGCFSQLYFMRNDFEKNKKGDTDIAKNYVVSFNANFFSTYKDGFKAVEKKAGLYNSFLEQQPEDNKELDDSEDIESEEYKLDVYTHLPASLFLNLAGSKFLFENSYVRVEIYSHGVLKGFTRSGRIRLTQDYWIDLRNISFFKKATFPNQSPGVYVVKVYLENLYFSERKFIGYSIVDLKEDTKIHLVCKPDCNIELNVVDQNNNGIKDVELEVLSQDVIILKTYSDSNGLISFSLPHCIKEEYQIRLVYKGFLIAQEKIKTSFLNTFLSYKKTFNVSLYDFSVEIKNKAESNVVFDVSLNSENMFNQFFIKPDSVSNNIYLFTGLPASDYDLIIKYDYLEFKEKVSIPKQNNKKINLYDIKIKIEDLCGLTPHADINIVLTCIDFEENIDFHGSFISNDEYGFSHIYPGNYSLKIYYKSYLFEEPFGINNENDFTKTIVLPIIYNVSINFYDSCGGDLSNGIMILNREGENISKNIGSNASVLFSVPPGIYNIEIYDDENLIAKRKIDVLNDKNIDIVTNKISSFLIIYSVFLIVFLLGFSILCLKNKNYKNLLKIIVIFLALISIVLPWWSINCASNDVDVKTSTNLYINTASIITLTETKNVSAGYFSTSNELFVSAIDIVVLLIYAGVFLFGLSIFLKHFLKKKKLSFICVLLSIIIFVSSTGLFLYSMSEFANATVGRLVGYGDLNVDIVGENIFEQVSCNWGLGIGFIVFAVVLILSFFVLFLEKKEKY